MEEIFKELLMKEFLGLLDSILVRLLVQILQVKSLSIISSGLSPIEQDRQVKQSLKIKIN